MIAESIDEVVSALDGIVAETRAAGSRLGYFPALYRKVTVQVREGIVRGDFEDGARMERLDVQFANRYLDAYDLYSRGETPTGSWLLAFRATQRWWPIVLQHLLVAMNAHINLDLGIAAARTVPGAELAGLRPDFMRINQVLASLVNDVKDELASVWPMLRLLDRLAGRAEDEFVNFSMAAARDEAWGFAESLSVLDRAGQEKKIREVDEVVEEIGRVVLEPPPIARVVTNLVRLGERGSVPQIIDLLSAQGQ